MVMISFLFFNFSKDFLNSEFCLFLTKKFSLFLNKEDNLVKAELLIGKTFLH